jgi:hypothetical protein
LGGLVVALFASVVACSMVLQEESIPCTTDADCAKYSGARCDVGSKQCVAGDAADTGTPPGDAGSEEDAHSPIVDAADGSLVDTGPDAPGVDAADTGADVTPPPVDGGDGGDASVAGIDWAGVTSYLDNLYNSTQQLVQRSPASGTYYGSPDNALAQRAFLYLPTPEPTKSTAILTRLQSFKICGCSETAGHDATINHQFDSLVTKGAIIPLDPSGDCLGVPTDTRAPTGTCSGADAALAPFCPPTGIYHEDRPAKQWGADSCNTTINGYSLPTWNQSGAGAGYADLIALEILSYRNQGLSTDTLWSLLLAKWDGVGMNDAATGPDGSYSIYKVALFKIAARALGQTLPSGVDDILIAAQGANGGIRTNYNAGKTWLDQAGTAEATALVVLAFRMPVTEF